MNPKKSAQNNTRRGCLYWLARTALALILVFVLLLAAGALYEGLESAADARRYPPPGQLVEVDGFRLHIHCTGTGSPTVILDHLGDGNSGEWALIQPEIAKTTRVCAYDRAGFGWSDPGPLPRTAGRAADELHAALQQAEIFGPYVLVGHSYGANVVSLFAAQYPQETAGLVTVDPGLYDTTGLPPDLGTSEEDTFVRAAPVLSRLGLLRLADRFGVSVSTGDLSADQAGAYLAMRQKNGFWELLGSVSEAMPETSAEMRAVTSLGDLPLIVLSADQPDVPFRRDWTEFNRRSAALSTRGEFRIISGADHASIVNQNVYADQVIQAVLDVLGL